MTYYELVTYIRSLREGDLTEEKIKKLNEFSLINMPDVKIRFTNQLIDLIDYRISSALKKFSQNIIEIEQNQNNLLLEINQVKEQIRSSKEILKLNVFNEELRNKLLEDIKKMSYEATTAIKSFFTNVNDTEVLLIINNLDLNN